MFGHTSDVADNSLVISALTVQALPFGTEIPKSNNYKIQQNLNQINWKLHKKQDKFINNEQWKLIYIVLEL